MSSYKRAIGTAAACAALALPTLSRAQTPTWAFAMLDTTPTVTATTGTTPFDRVTNAANFGSALVAGLPLPARTFTFTQGSAPTPGKVEIGALATETDDPATGFSINIFNGSVSNNVGTLALNNDSLRNGPTDFFEQNQADLTDPTSDPTWNGAAIQAGNSLTLDLGTLDLTKLLAYYDAQGPGTYDLTMNLGVAAYNASNGDPLDPDPNIPGNSVPRIPGPPAVEVIITVNPAAPPNVPEPGAMAMIVGLAVAGSATLVRWRAK